MTRRPDQNVYSDETILTIMRAKSWPAARVAALAAGMCASLGARYYYRRTWRAVILADTNGLLPQTKRQKKKPLTELAFIKAVMAGDA